MTVQLTTHLDRRTRWVVGLLFQIVLLGLLGRPAMAAVDAEQTLPEARACELPADDDAWPAPSSSCGGPGLVSPVPSRAVPSAKPPEPAAEGVEPTPGGAPMCDPTAASVVARVDVPEVDRGRFEPLPCPASALLLALLADPAGRWAHDGVATPGLGRQAPAPHQPYALDGLDGARLPPLFFPMRAEPRVLDTLADAGIGFSPGHPRAVERPPAR